MFEVTAQVVASDLREDGYVNERTGPQLPVGAQIKSTVPAFNYLL